ncbi:MAG: hypothetical protein COA42_05585 [Alteromonadaceae bacterium]|nr:MAG: hypothetical protein COA42_05585 [Alteromonadaceae bacterium]
MNENLINFNVLRESFVDTFNHLAVIVCADTPLTTNQLAEKAGVSIKGIQRIMDKDQKYLKTVRHREKRGYREGRPAEIAIVRTKAGERLLARCGVSQG